MMSGILWLPDFITFMFTFEFTADFVKQSSTVNPMKKLEIVTS